MTIRKNLNVTNNIQITIYPDNEKEDQIVFNIVNKNGVFDFYQTIANFCKVQSKTDLSVAEFHKIFCMINKVTPANIYQWKKNKANMSFQALCNFIKKFYYYFKYSEL